MNVLFLLSLTNSCYCILKTQSLSLPYAMWSSSCYPVTHDTLKEEVLAADWTPSVAEHLPVSVVELLQYLIPLFSPPSPHLAPLHSNSFCSTNCLGICINHQTALQMVPSITVDDSFLPISDHPPLSEWWDTDSHNILSCFALISIATSLTFVACLGRLIMGNINGHAFLRR